MWNAARAGKELSNVREQNHRAILAKLASERGQPHLLLNGHMMKRNLVTLSLLLLAPTALTGTAQAQWADDIESYANGSAIEGQGGWRGWDAQNTGFSVVSQNFAFDGVQSLSANPGADTIQEYVGITSGEWILKIQQYVPTGLKGKSDINLMNLYQDFGPYEWSSTISFNGTNNMVECYCGSGVPDSTPLLYDQWVELRWVIDLDGDWVDFYYGATHLGGYAWSSGPFGGNNYTNLAIQAIDLYPFPNSTGAVYYDAFSLQPCLTTKYCNPGDGSSSNFATIDISSCLLNGSVTVDMTNGPAGQFSYLLIGNGNQVVSQPPGAVGDLCVAGGGCLGRYSKDPGQIDSAGSFSTDISNSKSGGPDFGIPTCGGNILSGETWYFQYWHRQAGGLPSTFSEAIGVTFY
jgi:hypothetical protein